MPVHIEAGAYRGKPVFFRASFMTLPEHGIVVAVTTNVSFAGSWREVC